MYLSTPCGFGPGSPALLMWAKFLVTTVVNPDIDLMEVEWSNPDRISGCVPRECGIAALGPTPHTQG